MSTWFRAAVMLLVLVGGPAAWIYYGPLPAGAQRVADRLIQQVRTAVAEKVQGDRAVDAPLVQPSFAVSEAPAWAIAGSADKVSEGSAAAQSRTTELDAEMEPLLAQLRERGAAEYALEQWGSFGQLYRFRCAMPLASDDRHVEQFEAIAADPRAAVLEVLESIAIR